MRDLRSGSEEQTSDTTIVAAPTEDSSASGHGSLESLDSEADRSVPGLNSNGSQSLASSDVACQDDILSGGKVLSTPEMEEELRGRIHERSLVSNLRFWSQI